jgi:ubiquinone biosynthesis protein COQ4
MLGSLRNNQINYYRVFKGTMALFRDPEDTDKVFDISDGLRDSTATRLALAHLRANPEVAAILDERYLGPAIDLPALQRLPPGTLGRAFADDMLAKGFDPEFARPIDVTSADITYVEFRCRKTHDIWHLVCGFGTDVPGELSIQAFRFAQVRLPLGPILLAGGLLQALINAPAQLPRILDEITRGWRMGVRARPFLAQKWEQRWSTPLARIRDEMGVADYFAADGAPILAPG